MFVQIARPVRIGMFLLVFGALSSSAARAEFAVVAGWDHQLFPSYLVATAAILPSQAQAEQPDDVLGDSRGALGVKVTAPEDDTAITVTVLGNDIFAESTFSGTLATKDQAYTVFPRIKYNYAELIKNKQAIPVTATFRVEIGDEAATEETVTLTLRSINDCPYSITRGEQSVDISFMFAAYVNEQHPFVDKFLREALDGSVVNSFTGYQSGDTGEVYRQVYALWNALSDRDVRYSNITTTAVDSNMIGCQHVRLLDESINNGQANCVDGSVLLASLLRKVDIEPVLVFIPGHCYLGFFLDAKREKLELLETTLMGSEAGEEPTKIEALQDVVDATWNKKNSWGTFCDAIAMGREEFAKNEAKFGDPKNVDYQMVPIAAARQQGILPIAFDAVEEFAPKAGSEE